MNKFIVVLSSDGDLMQLHDDNIYRATFEIAKATKFDTEAQATEIIKELSIRSMWNEAHVRSIWTDEIIVS
jgi:hypothetical protein